MRGITKALIGAIERGVLGGFSFEVLLEYARLNKVEVSFLRSVGVKDLLGGYMERVGRVVRAVEEIAAALEGLDYVFYKLVRPVEYVPADIDMLVEAGHAPRAVERLRGLSYRVAVREKYTVTLVRGPVIVDVYVHPSIGGAVAYLDGSRLLAYRATATYHGVAIPALERGVEAVVVAAHALLKENVYTLNDYYTAREWIDEKAIGVAEELGCGEVVEIALGLNRAVDVGLVETPYKQPGPVWAMRLLRRVARDPRTRSTLASAVAILRDRRIGRTMVTKLTRRSY